MAAGWLCVHSNCFCSKELQLAASKGCEVGDNDIDALKSICDCLTDKGSAFHSTTEWYNCTKHL